MNGLIAEMQAYAPLPTTILLAVCLVTLALAFVPGIRSRRALSFEGHAGLDAPAARRVVPVPASHDDALSPVRHSSLTGTFIPTPQEALHEH